MDENRRTLEPIPDYTQDASIKNAWDTFASDSLEPSRSLVAKHPSVPIGVLELLAKDESRDVRMVVAKREDTPVSLLNELAKDKDSLVVEAANNNITSRQ